MAEIKITLYPEVIDLTMRARHPNLGNAEDSVPFRVDGVLAVELDGGEGVGHQRPTVPDPLDRGGGLTPEPEVVPDWSALLQGDVVHAVALQVRRHWGNLNYSLGAFIFRKKAIRLN